MTTATKLSRSLLLASVCFSAALAAAGKARPNIVWIFSDDHTNQAIGAYGGPLAQVDPTPNIDRLAAEGMRFEHCYVGNSICAPARATLLTGKHSHLHGKIDNRGGFNHDQQQFQKILQKHGYQTAMIGKIHLSGKMQGLSLVPLLKGKTPGDWRDALYYHYYEYPGVHSVRRHEGVSDGRMKLIRFYGPDVPDGEQWELFDLQKDPREMKSVYREPGYQVTVRRLKQKLDELKERYEVPDEG